MPAKAGKHEAGSNGMQPIFISADASDLEFVKALKQVLLVNEFDVADGTAIREALAAVVVLSPASILSPEVSYEWAFAIGSRVPVLPLLLHVSESDLHPRLNTLQHLDFSGSGNPPWDALLRALHKIQARQQNYTLRAPSNAPAIVQIAAQALDDADPDVREAALATLDDMDHPAATELLAQALRHPVDQVRLGALTQLARQDDLRAMPFLLEAVRSGWEGMKPWMLAMGRPSIPLLIKALQDQDSAVASSAAWALGLVGGADSAEALIESLRNGMAERRLVIRALGDSGEPSAIPVLIEAASDHDREVRHSAIDALVKCGVKANTLPALLPVFIAALQDEYDQVGIRACEGLEVSGIPEAAAALLHGAISNEDDQVRASSRSSLKRMPVDLPRLLRERAKDCSAVELRRIYSLLSEFRQEGNVSFFVEGTMHPDSAIRTSAVNGLEYSRAAEAVEALLDRLEDEDSFVRGRALDCLSQIAGPACVSRLKQYLYDEEIAAKVAEILEKTATKECRQALRTWKDQRRK